MRSYLIFLKNMFKNIKNLSTKAAMLLSTLGMISRLAPPPRAFPIIVIMYAIATLMSEVFAIGSVYLVVSAVQTPPPALLVRLLEILSEMGYAISKNQLPMIAGGIAIGAIVIRAILAISMKCFLISLEKTQKLKLRKIILDRILDAGFDALTVRSRGEVFSVLEVQSKQIGGIWGAVLVGASAALMLTGFLFAGMAIVSGVDMFAAGIVVPFAAVTIIVGMKAQKLVRSQLDAQQSNANAIIGLLATIRHIKINSRLEKVRGKIYTAFDVDMNTQEQVRRFEAISTEFNTALVLTLATLGIVYVVSSAQMSMAEISTLAIVVFRMLTPIQDIGKSFTRVLAARPSVRRVTKMENALAMRRAKTSNKPFPQMDVETVTVRGLGFAHRSGENKHTIFENVNFSVERGTLGLIVGASGSGKSTILDIIAQLRRDYDGRVCADGHNVIDFNIDSWQRHIDYIPQEPYVLRTTVRENLCIDLASDVPDTALWGALAQVQMEEKVKNFPHGLDEYMSDAGANLSGGEKLRLSIARAFLGNKSIILLDEPTSSLDAATAAIVTESILKLRPNRIIIAASHDANFIQAADRILHSFAPPTRESESQNNTTIVGQT